MERVLFFVVFTFNVLFANNGANGCRLKNGQKEDQWFDFTGNNVYEECHKTLENSRLIWLDVKGNIISSQGPGTEEQYVENVDGSVNFFINRLSKTQSGTYKCMETTPKGKTEICKFVVEVADRMTFVDTPEKQIITNGKNSFIKCTVMADYTPTVSWYRSNGDNQTKIVDISNEKYELSSNGLTINNVTDEDEGTYKCFAEIMRTGEYSDMNIIVEVLFPPVIDELVPSQEEVTVGDPFSLTCIANGSADLVYQWRKIENGNITWIEEDNTIIFDKINATDDGIYSCKVQNSVGFDEKQIRVTVRVFPEILSFNNITAAEGDKAVAYCYAMGRPNPTIGFIHTQGVLSDEDIRIGYLPTESPDEVQMFLEISKTNREHTGPLICNATNELGSKFEVMYITVQYAPYFDEPIEHVYAWEDSPINFTCDYKSEPDSTIEWRFTPDKPINDILSPHTKVHKYLKSKSHNILESSKNVHLDVHSDNELGTYYELGTYECLANNSLGMTKKTFIVKKGTLPPSIKRVITNVQATSATLTIEIPEAGPKIVGIIVEYDIMENYLITDIHQNRTWAVDRPFRLEGLVPNTTYGFRVAAINEVGTGEFSDVMDFITPEKFPRSIPEQLQLKNNSMRVLDNGDVVLELETLEDNNDPIDHISVTHCPIPVVEDDKEILEAKCTKYEVPASTQLVLKNLTVNCTYALSIAAHNSLGYSKPLHVDFEIPESISELPLRPQSILSAGAIIGISIVVVVLCILLLDILLFVTRRQGLLATCCLQKKKKTKEADPQSRDRKGLLKDAKETVAEESTKTADNGHKEYEYNKVTGIITGKHSSV